MEDAPDRMSEEQQLALLVRQAVDYAIFMMDPEGVIITWNAGAQRLKGYARDEIVGRHFSTFYTEADRARDHPAAELVIASKAGRYEEEGWRVRKDGSRFWANVVITALRDEDGRLIGFGKVTRDLTERRRNEEALRAAVEELRAVNEELDRFAMVAAHDMTDPLRTISGFAEILVDGDPGGEDAQQYSQHILDSSRRLTAMLQSLLAFARAGAKSPGSIAVDLATAVEQVRSDLAVSLDARNVRVMVAVPEGSAVLAGTDDVRMVLQNLIGNAIKFSDAEKPVIRIEATRRDEVWNVSVRDNGRGIASEDQVRIFGAFERARSGAAGYGLGLAICERLVERHGGRIGVDSAPGQGTHFWFTLPAADPGADAAPDPPAPT